MGWSYFQKLMMSAGHYEAPSTGVGDAHPIKDTTVYFRYNRSAICTQRNNLDWVEQ